MSSHSGTAIGERSRRDRSSNPRRWRKSPGQHKRYKKIDSTQERWKHGQYSNNEEKKSNSSFSISDSDNESWKQGSKPLQEKQGSKKMSRNYRDMSRSGDERRNPPSRKTTECQDVSKSRYNISDDNNDDLFKSGRRRSKKGSSTKHGRDKSPDYKHGMDIEDQTSVPHHRLSGRLGRDGRVNRRRSSKRDSTTLEDESDAEQNCQQMEAMYLPSTEGLDQQKLRRNLLDGMDTTKSRITARPGLRMDEDGKLYFLVRSGSPRNFKKAKELVIQVVQEVLKKMRLEAKNSQRSGSISSSKVDKKSSRRASVGRLCSDVSESSSDDKEPRRSSNHLRDGRRRRRSSDGSRCIRDHSPPCLEERSRHRNRDRNSRSKDFYYRDDPDRGERFFRSCHDDRYYKNDSYAGRKTRYPDEMHENNRDYSEETRRSGEREKHYRGESHPRGCYNPRRNNRQSRGGRYSRRDATYDGRHGNGDDYPDDSYYADDLGPSHSGADRDWPGLDCDRPVASTSGVALVHAASAGMLAFLYNLSDGVTEDKLRSAITHRFGSLQSRNIEHVVFQQYQSDALRGLAVLKFRTKSQVYVLMKSPTLDVDETSASILDLQGLMESSDTLLKNRFASVLRRKAHSRRLPGVFPQGVQPERIVLVVDERAPHLDLDKLNSSVTSKIIRGVDLDAVGFHDLIREDDIFDTDNVLYVVIPWMSFFLKQLCIMPNKATNTSTAAKDKMKSSLEVIVSSLNVVKDFCYNPILQSNFDGSSDFFSCLETPYIANTGVEKAAEGLSHRLIYAAHNLRCSVLSRTQNSEVVFCGFPVTSFITSEAKQHSAMIVGDDQAEEICATVLTSMRVFNKFAASTWKLGGFEFSDLESLEDISDEHIDPVIGDSASHKSEQPYKASQIKNSGMPCDHLGDSDESDLDCSKAPSGKTSLRLNECGVFSLDDWPSLKWVSSRTVPTPADSTNAPERAAVSAIKELPSEKNVQIKSLPTSNLDAIAPEQRQETGESLSGNKETHRTGDCGTVHTANETEIPGNLVSEHPEKMDGRSDAVVTNADLPSKEGVKEEKGFSKAIANAISTVDNNSLKLEELNEENIKGMKDFKVIEMKSSSKEPVEGASSASGDIVKRSPVEQKQAQTRSLLNTKKLKGAYTNEIIRASLQVTRIWKKKGNFLPWSPLESEKFDSGTLPDIVAVSIEHHIYKEQWNGQLRQTEYNCLKCKGCSGDLSWAERHAYDRKHIGQLLNNSPELPPEVGHLLVTGGSACGNAYGLTKEFLQKMVRARLLYIDDSKKKEVAYDCLVCKQRFNKVSLRVHLGSFEHRSHLNSHLGLVNPESAVTLTENWPVIKRLFRHSSFDTVVLIADSSLRSTLLPFVRPNVHLYTLPDLVMSEDSQTEALKRWNLDSNQLLQDLDDPRVLWIVVAGLDLLLQPRLKSFFDSTTSITITEESNAKQEAITAGSPNPRTDIVPANNEASKKLSEVVDEKTASRKDLARSIQQVMDFIKHDPEVDDIESSEVLEALASERHGAGSSGKDSSGIKSEAVDVQNEFLREGYQIEQEVALKKDASVGATGQADELKGSKEHEDIDSETGPDAERVEKSFKREANDCCGSFSWDVTAESNFYRSLDKALNSLNDLRSFLRSRLDVGHTVVTMPVAPLHIVFDTVPEETQRALACIHQTVIVRADQVFSVQRAYFALFKKTYSLYRSIAEQENVLFVEASAMEDACVSIVKNQQGDVQWLNMSSWHAPLENIILGAFTGLPCLYPKPTSVSYSELSLWPRSTACAIIGVPMVTPANEYTQHKLFHIPRRLTFSESDVKFIVNALAARTNYDKSVTWTCYLVCPFPDILFTSQVLSLCGREGCANPIIAWKYKKNQSLHRVMDRITSFISLLSYALGPGNFTTIYPTIPTAVVAFDEVNPESHPILHTVAMKNMNQNAHFCEESYRDVVSPIINKFRKGLTDIFNKTKMCSPIEIDDGENFAFIKPSPLMRHCESLIKLSDAKEWLTLVNSILQNNHSSMAVMRSNAMNEAEHIPSVFNPFPWTAQNLQGQPIDPNSADQMAVLGGPVTTYNSVGFSYEPNQSTDSRGRGGPPARGLCGGRGRAGFQGGPRFGGTPGFMPQRFNGPPGYFGPPPPGFSGGPPGFNGPPGFHGPLGFRGHGRMFPGRAGFYGPQQFLGPAGFQGPQPFPDPNFVSERPDISASLEALGGISKNEKKYTSNNVREGAASASFKVADYIGSVSSGSESSLAPGSDARSRTSRGNKHSPYKSRSRSLQKSSDRKRKKSARSSSVESDSKSSKRRRKSRLSTAAGKRHSKSKKTSSQKSRRSKHGYSSDEICDYSDEETVVVHRRSKKNKKKRHPGNRSNSGSSNSSSEEYDARNPKTMISKKQKEDVVKASSVAAVASSSHKATAAQQAAPTVSVGVADPSTANPHYKDILSRIEHAMTMTQVEETKSQLAATEAAAAPATGFSRYSVKLTSGQNTLQQVWIRRLISYFQLQPDSVQLEDGSWLLRSNNSGVVAFLVKRLSSCRLLGARLSATLHSAQDNPTAAAPDTDVVYGKILEQFVAEYNDNLVTSLVLQVSTETDTSFFGADWQHVYTSGLTNTFLIAADAIRSLGRRLPRPGPPTPRILIVSPDSSTARCLAMILQPVLAAASTDMLFVKGDGRIDLSREVVLGTVHHLSEVEDQLPLQGLRAMIIDDAGFMVSSPLHSILVAQLVAHLRASVGDYGSVNIVAVADHINVNQLTKAEILLGCRFIRTDLKQHFALPTPTPSSERLKAPPPQILKTPPSQRLEVPPPGHYDHPSQTSTYGEAAWPPPPATNSRVLGNPGSAQSIRYSEVAPASGQPVASLVPCPSAPAQAPGYNAPCQVQQQQRIVPPGYSSSSAGEQPAPAGYYGHKPPAQHSGPPSYFMNRPPPAVPAPGYAQANAPPQYSGVPRFGDGAPPQQLNTPKFPSSGVGNISAAYQHQGGQPGSFYTNEAANQRPPPTGYHPTQPTAQQQQQQLGLPASQLQQQSTAGRGYCITPGQPNVVPPQQHQQQHQSSYSHYYNQ